MTEVEAVIAARVMEEPVRVHVDVGQASYDGWLIMAGKKRNRGPVRVVIEDDRGQLLIHRADQIEFTQ